MLRHYAIPVPEKGCNAVALLELRVVPDEAASITVQPGNAEIVDGVVVDGTFVPDYDFVASTRSIQRWDDFVAYMTDEYEVGADQELAQQFAGGLVRYLYLQHKGLRPALLPDVAPESPSEPVAPEDVPTDPPAPVEEP